MANPTNLYEYFQSVGKSLPSLQERGKLYEQYGLGSAATYGGSAQQNTSLLQKLVTPVATPVQQAPVAPPVVPPAAPVSPVVSPSPVMPPPVVSAPSPQVSPQQQVPPQDQFAMPDVRNYIQGDFTDTTRYFADLQRYNEEKARRDVITQKAEQLRSSGQGSAVVNPYLESVAPQDKGLIQDILKPENYTVQAGDTINTIAARLGVNAADISGYRSGNPNLIYPGEVLTITPQAEMQAAPKVSGVPEGVTVDSQAVYDLVNQGIEDPQQIYEAMGGRMSVEDINATLTQLGSARGTTLPGAKTPQDAFNETLQLYGFSPDKFAEAFAIAPQKSVQDFVTEILNQTGFAQIKAKVAEVNKEIEDIANQRDKEISAVETNPWLSESLKSRKVAKVGNDYEGKLNNRINALKVYQGLHDEVLSQAQSAAQQAVSTMKAEQGIKQDQLKFILDQAEKAADLQQTIQKEAFKQSLDMEKLKKTLGSKAVATISAALKPTIASAAEPKVIPPPPIEPKKFSTDPLVDAWAQKVARGEAKLSDITGVGNQALRNDIILALKDTPFKTGEEIAVEQKKQSEALKYYNQVNSLLSNQKALEYATGLSGVLGYVPFTKTRAVQSQIEQLKAAIDLNSREKLKGQGTITDREMEILSKSASTLSKPFLSDTAAIQELKNIRAVFAFAGGLEAPVVIRNLKTGKSAEGSLSRVTYEKAVTDGYIITFK